MYQLKIMLMGIRPPIWRRILVPSTMRLCCLHDTIQVVFGWTDTHLHNFEQRGAYWGVPDEEFEEMADEGKVSVGNVLVRVGDSMTYTYDFGDDWRHKILLERVLPAGAISRPVCLGGRRHRPPEDVGGPSGYQEFLNASLQPEHGESEQLRKWAGGRFHAEEFNLKGVNEVLESMGWRVKHRR